MIENHRNQKHKTAIKQIHHLRLQTISNLIQYQIKVSMFLMQNQNQLILLKQNNCKINLASL